MLQAKQLFSAILLTGLLFSWGGVKAQDPISKNNNYGAYTGGNQSANQNVIINNDQSSPIPSPGFENTINPPAQVNFLGGIENLIQGVNTSPAAISGNLLYGRKNEIDLNEGGTFTNSVAMGFGNTLEAECSECIALGFNNQISGGESTLSFGEFSRNQSGKSILIGFGASSTARLQDVGNRSITLGTFNAGTTTPYNTLNIRPPSTAGNFSAPVTGIGITSPDAKLSIKNTGGNSSSTILNLRDNSSNKVFTVKNNGVVGINRSSVFSTGATPSVDLTVEGETEKNNSNSSWLTPSDKRLKRNIRPFEDGLSTLMKIDPVRFEFNGKRGTKEGENGIGVIAQEIQKVAPYMIYGQEKSNEYLSYSADALWYILVNAVKEQQNIIKKQKQQRKDKIEKLEKRIAELEAQMKAHHSSRNTSPNVKPENQKSVELTNKSIKNPILYQNIPNPFRDETVIKYYLPDNSRSAQLLIASTQKGTVLKRISLESNGKGQINLRTNNLNPGTYSYTLLVNGEQVQSQKMIIKP